MKNNQMLLLLSMLLVVSCSFKAIAQFDLSDFPRRYQDLNQYTSVFICSPNDGTIIQGIHDDASQTTWFNSDKFYDYDATVPGYITLAEESPTTTMQPGKGYVIQLGGNGNYNQTIVDQRKFDFTGGSANNGTINVGVTSGEFNLLGNPYSNFLDLDAFLLDSNNASKIRGPIMLWSHNTVISNANINPNDTISTYRNSANDFALYNVLGGVAAGRQISTSSENDTYTGVPTPTGKICFGTGFGIYAIGTGDIVYENSMRTSDNGGEDQSYRGVLASASTDQKIKTPTPVTNTDPEAFPFRNRIWVNIEEGTIPTLGSNFNQLKQLLVGYADGATTADNDRVFDAETVTVQSRIEFYSLAAGSTKHLAIQGRNNSDFSGTDYFQLGYHVTDPGDYTFTAISDGVFASGGGKPYFISDYGVLHEFPYTANIPAAEITNSTRFKIVYGQKSLALKLNIEGYYDVSTHLMRSVKVNQGTSVYPTEVADLTIELRTTSNALAFTSDVILATNGSASISFPTLPVDSYYVVVKHRNAIQTWSANPVEVVATLLYDFTTAASQAYGSNQIEVEPGIFAFYSGDINQDESIDISDGTPISYDSDNSNYGDFVTDLNGDGSVDLSDISIFSNNAANSIYSMHP